PGVGVWHRDPQHPPPVGADQQRRPARPRSWQQLAVACLVEAPVEVDRAVPEQRPDDRERLVETGDPLLEREAEGPELDVVPARAEPEDEAATRDLVDRRRLLREQGGIVEAGAGDERSDRDP